MDIFCIGLFLDAHHRPRHWLIYFLVYHDFIQFIILIEYTRDPSSMKVGQYSSGNIFDICLAYLAKKARIVITF